MKKEQGHGQHNLVRKEGLRGRTSLLCNPQNDQEREASHKRSNSGSGCCLGREHLCLIVVLVIEHLVHGMGTEHQEGNVDVPTDLEDIAINMSFFVMGEQDHLGCHLSA